MTHTYYTYGGIACDQVIQAVWDFLDGEIDSTKKQQIARHLEQCDHCRDQYTFEGSFLRAVGRLLERDAETLLLRDRIETELTRHGFSKMR
jgi:anti-sigma factor (TIGR02949 family)